MKKINLFKVINLENQKIEKIINVGLIICLVLLFLVQGLMVNPLTRTVMTQEEKVEGVFLTNSGQLLDKGTIVLELENLDNLDNLWVLINGQRIARFSRKQIILSVNDGEIIEIDGTGTSSIARVKVISHSENVSLAIENNVQEINKNIRALARVRVNNLIN